MKPERTIQRMYDRCPELFYTRQRALNHLFLTIGNGYTWCKGELVRCEEICDYDPDADEYFDNPDLLEPDLEPDLALAVPPPNEQENIKRAAESSRWWHNERHPGEPYDESAHRWSYHNKDCSYIYNLPDDITPEWKKVADECAELLRQDGIEFE